MDPAMIERIRQEGLKSLTPVILRILPFDKNFLLQISN
jgi:hypothetical protein